MACLDMEMPFCEDSQMVWAAGILVNMQRQTSPSDGDILMTADPVQTPAIEHADRCRAVLNKYAFNVLWPSPSGTFTPLPLKPAPLAPRLDNPVTSLQELPVMEEQEDMEDLESMRLTPVSYRAPCAAQQPSPSDWNTDVEIEALIREGEQRQLEVEFADFEYSRRLLEEGARPVPLDPPARLQRRSRVTPSEDVIFDISSREEGEISDDGRGRSVESKNVSYRPRKLQDLSLMSDRLSKTKAYIGGEYLERLDQRQQEQYVPLKVLGTGGQGSVHLLKTRRSGELVACKVIPARPADAYHQSELSFLRDALPAHPRIIKLRSALISPFQTQLYLDYCDGGCLGSFMKKVRHHNDLEIEDPNAMYDPQRVPEAFIWHAFLQISEALAYIHTGLDRDNPVNHQCPDKWLSVIHRDIKPGNVLLQRRPCHPDHPGPEPYPRIVLADFGLALQATDFNDTPRSREKVGTFIWQPPELPYASPKGDVWAAGAIAYHMALGYIPTDDLPSDFEDMDDVGDAWKEILDVERELGTFNGEQHGGKYSRGLWACIDRALTLRNEERADSTELFHIILGAEDRGACEWKALEPWVWE
ncbi:MAG: hypothetical protein Q9220_002956 [cf. Caloplaca sp. 1 TL-2023]